MAFYDTEATQVDTGQNNLFEETIEPEEIHLESVSPAVLAQLRGILQELADVLQTTGPVCELRNLDTALSGAKTAYQLLPMEVKAELQKHLPPPPPVLHTVLLDQVPQLDNKTAMAVRLVLTLLFSTAIAVLGR